MHITSWEGTLTEHQFCAAVLLQRANMNLINDKELKTQQSGTFCYSTVIKLFVTSLNLR